MWTFGYTEWVPEDSSPLGSLDAIVVRNETIWGDCSTFREAITLLYGKVVEMVSKTDEPALIRVMLDIRIIVDDPGIMDDPDQWEQDNTFELNPAKEFFVTQS